MTTVTKENITIHDFTRICRTCLSTKELRPIYGVLNSDCTPIPYLLNKYTEIEVNYQNNLPGQICSKCLVTLNSVCLFLKNCNLINKTLIECSTRLESTITNNSYSSHPIEYVKNEIKEEPLETIYLEDFHNDCPTESTNDQDILPLKVENLNSSIDIKDEQPEESIEKMDIAHSLENEFYSEEEINPDDPDNENQFDDLSENSLDAKTNKSNKRLKIKKQLRPNIFIKCTVCSKQIRKSYMSRHIRLHEPRKNHKCEKCGAAFQSMTSYIKHIKSNCNIRGKCTICRKELNKDYISNHMKLHDTRILHSCEKCQAKFLLLSSYLRHTATDCGKAKKIKEEDMRVKCNICHREMKKRSIYMHMKMHCTWQ